MVGVVLVFEDRIDAGRRLAEALAAYRGMSGAAVFGIPRGGVIVAAEVARGLALPLGVAIAAKVGAPGYSEYAIGAVAADGVVTANPQAGYAVEAVESLADEARAKVVRETARLVGMYALPNPAGRTAILVDDGLATGLTAIAAAEWLKRAGASKVVVAVPVAPPSTVREILRHADEAVALETPEWFQAVGQFYRRFGQTADAEVERALAASAQPRKDGE